MVRIHTQSRRAGLVLLALMVTGCGGKDSPTGPTNTPAATLTAPTLDTPAMDAQLDTLRPTLTVKNATSDQAGTRTYEFQISDTNAFASVTSSAIAGFASTVDKANVPEGGNGTTSFRQRPRRAV